MPQPTRIANRRAAAVFASPRQRKLLLSLIERERSLSQLARLTGTPLNLLHHHMQKLLRLGLVRIAREQARAGAPIKYYRATSREFFVPAELLPAEPSAGLHSKLRELLAASLARSVQGVLYSHDDDGPRMRVVREKARRTEATELWCELRLAPADVASLAEDLREVLHRFEARSKRPFARVLVHAAIAPVQ